MLLLDTFHGIPLPGSWTVNQVANVINLFSAAGTVGALWYAFHLERKNSKKINDLANITAALQKQNEFAAIQLKDAATPLFSISSVEKITEKRLHITLYNRGQKAIVTSTTDKAGNIELPFTSGREVLANSDFVIYCDSIEIPVGDDLKYSLFVDYTDIYGNAYVFWMSGRGTTITAWSNPFALPRLTI